MADAKDELKKMVTLGARYKDAPGWQGIRTLPEVQLAALEVLEEFMGTWKEVASVELAAGIEVEKEHTTNAVIAEKIARDHCSEDAEYYKKLESVGL